MGTARRSSSRFKKDADISPVVESESSSGSGSESSEDESLLHPAGSIIFGSGSEFVSAVDAARFSAELYSWPPSIDQLGVNDKVDVYDTEKKIWYAARVIKTNRRSTFSNSCRPTSIKLMTQQ